MANIRKLGLNSNSPIGFQALAMTGAALALTLPTIKAGDGPAAKFAEIQAQGGAVYWRDDASASSVTNAQGGGQNLGTGQSMWYAGDLSKLNFIGTAGTTVVVSYYA